MTKRKLITGSPFLPPPGNNFQPQNETYFWCDHSNSNYQDAIGDFRMPGVSNGRYENLHPIYDASGNIYGYLKNAMDTLGYTFDYVYARGCFWVAHHTFASTMNGGDTELSLVRESGRFIFYGWLKYTGVPKFSVFKSFSLGKGWVSSVRAFKLIDNDNFLFYLCDWGACLFNVESRNVVSVVRFSESFYSWLGWAFHPDKRLLAIPWCIMGEKGPDDQYICRNLIRIYNLDHGETLCECNLQTNCYNMWLVAFNGDGSSLKVWSDKLTFYFDLM